MPNNNPAGTNQYTKDRQREPAQQGGGQHGGSQHDGGQQQSEHTGKDDANSFANDPEKAREAGRKGGKS